MDDGSGEAEHLSILSVGVNNPNGLHETSNGHNSNRHGSSSTSRQHRHQHRHHRRTHSSSSKRLQNEEDDDNPYLRKRPHQSRSLRDLEEGVTQDESNSSNSDSDDSDSDDADRETIKKKHKHRTHDTQPPSKSLMRGSTNGNTPKKPKSVRFQDQQPQPQRAPQLFTPQNTGPYDYGDDTQATPAVAICLVGFVIMIIFGILVLSLYSHAPSDETDIHPIVKFAHSVTHTTSAAGAPVDEH